MDLKTNCFIVAALLVLANSGCQSLPISSSSANAEPSLTARDQAIAWNPEGLIIDPDFLAFGNPSVGRKIPVKRIELDPKGTTIIEFIDQAYGLSKINAIQDSKYFDTFVLRKRGLLEDIFPLAMITRYDLGNIPVKKGDSIGLVDKTWAKITLVNRLDDPTGESRYRITAKGMVSLPGVIEITPEEEDDDELLGSDYLIKRAIGREDTSSTKFLVRNDNRPVPNLMIVSRVIQEQSVAPRIQRIFLPIENAEVYRLDESRRDEDEETATGFDKLYRFKLADGDALDATHMNVLPELLRVRIAESAHKSVEKFRSESRNKNLRRYQPLFSRRSRK